ncbi:hypothetical protein [Streptosporangium roseum]|uniref:hypothetical protein n=1 Tax=Streptosporangium roseum TaxID=2001 RepID=UPI0012DC7CDF|nr:hypothetical protein [Streptosporangium roseum]
MDERLGPALDDAGDADAHAEHRGGGDAARREHGVDAGQDVPHDQVDVVAGWPERVFGLGPFVHVQVVSDPQVRGGRRPVPAEYGGSAGQGRATRRRTTGETAAGSGRTGRDLAFDRR